MKTVLNQTLSPRSMEMWEDFVMDAMRVLKVLRV